MSFERGGWSQYGIEAGTARVICDPLAEAKVIADQITFGDIEDLAHPRSCQIEHSQSADARLADTPNDFERRDSTWLVMAEQLSPRAVLARRRIPDARTVGAMIPSGRYRRVSRVEQCAFR